MKNNAASYESSSFFLTSIFVLDLGESAEGRAQSVETWYTASGKMGGEIYIKALPIPADN